MSGKRGRPAVSELARRIEALGFTQSELAERFGVTRVTVARWIAAEKPVLVAVVKAWEAAAIEKARKLLGDEYDYAVRVYGIQKALTQPREIAAYLKRAKYEDETDGRTVYAKAKS